MIVYIEGVDGTGKSTLVKQLELALLESELFNSNPFTIISDANKLIPTHPNKPNRINSYDLCVKWDEMAQDKTTIYIIDRGPISDIIYRTFDDYCPVMLLRYAIVMIQMYSYSTLCILCDSDKSEEIMNVRGDDNPIAKTYHQELRYLFQQIMGMFNSVKYDIGELSQSEISIFVNKLVTQIASKVKGMDKHGKKKLS